jgi:hypothetical protein
VGEDLWTIKVSMRCSRERDERRRGKETILEKDDVIFDGVCVFDEGCREVG